MNLSFEILGEIFEAACLTEESLYRRGSNSLRETRGAIGLTCLQWRNAALQHPALWSSIVVLCSKKLTRYTEPRFPNPSLIPLEAQRAGGLPIALSVSIDKVPHMDNIVRALESLTSHCGYLHIWVTDLASTTQQRLLALLAPHHRITSMDVCNEDGRWCTLQLINLPSLRSLNILGGAIMLRPELFTVCSITRLHVSDCVVFLSSLRDLINACCDLRTLSCESLDVDHDFDRDPSPPPYSVSTLSSLKHIRLSGGSAYELFMGLYAPELTLLVLDDPPQESFDFREFLSSLDCNKLQTVLFTDSKHRVARNVVLSKAVASFLRAHPELVMVQGYLDSELVDCLGEQTSSGLYFTDLREVHVDNCGEDVHTQLALARRLLELRRDHGQPLQPPVTLHLPNGSSVTEAEEITLEMVISCGDKAPGHVHTQGYTDQEQLWKGYRGACISSRMLGC